MTRSVHVSTSTCFEVEVDLSGTYAPGYLPSHDDPGHDGEVEEVDVDGIYGLKLIVPPGTLPMMAREWKRVDLLDGLDKAARIQIAKNILEYLESEADQLIIDEAHNV